MKQDNDFITVTRLRGAIDASTHYLDEQISTLGRVVSKEAEKTRTNSDINSRDIRFLIQEIGDKQSAHGEKHRILAKTLDSTQSVLRFVSVVMLINIGLAVAILCNL